MPQTKCAVCKRWMSRVKGRPKRVSTQADIDRCLLHFGKAVAVNEMLCGTCRYFRQNSQSAASTEAESTTDSDREDEDFTVDPERETFVYEVPRTSAHTGRCLVCKSTQGLRIINFVDRHKVFKTDNIFIPKGCRTCEAHRIINIDPKNDLSSVEDHAELDVTELRELLRDPPQTLFARVGSLQVSNVCLGNLVGFSREQFTLIIDSLPTLRSSRALNAAQALFMFLMKLRSGSSQRFIASLLELKNPKLVSTAFASVAEAFKRDVLGFFGPQSLTREILLTATTSTARRLLRLSEDQVALVLDGTYIRHQKSTNNAFQRLSYSGQKKCHLCKPFTICTTNGYIVDFAGPFFGTENDASIVKKVLEDQTLLSLLRPNDALVVDRGFRDSVQYMRDKGFQVYMPAMKGNREQIPCAEANLSRRITKVRWVVEAVHGRVAQRYKLLHHVVDNKLLYRVPTLCKIVGYLENRFGGLSWGLGDSEMEILDRMDARQEVPNELGERVEHMRWLQRPTTLERISAADLTDFPRLTERELVTLASGPYQMKLASSYLAETLDVENNVSMRFVKAEPSIVRVDIRSRHVSRKTYRLFVQYESGLNRIEGIRAHWCECPNGSRTVGCCAHVAAAIYYLSHARYLPTLRRPAADLVGIFMAEDDQESQEDEADD